jgi:hypothetical protein
MRAGARRDLWGEGRRPRNGRLRTVLECGAGCAVEFVIALHRKSAVLVRRSIAMAAGRATVDLRARRRVRAGLEVRVAISSRIIIDEGPSNNGFPTVGSEPIGGCWRVGLR